MQNITIEITAKDFEKNSYSASGRVIDELAYAAKEYTEEDLYNSAFEYEPSEPYNFDFEADLLQNTKTKEDIYKLIKILKLGLNANVTRLAKEEGLQVGAWLAINDPGYFKDLLKAYTEAVKDQEYNNITISKDYEKELQEAKDDYWKDQQHEWLYGDHRDYIGVIRLISKYFTENEDAGEYDVKNDTFTFTISEEEAKDQFEGRTFEDFTEDAYRSFFMDEIRESASARKEKDRIEREKRQKQYAEEKAYKEKRAKEAEEERLAKLRSLKA